MSIGSKPLVKKISCDVVVFTDGWSSLGHALTEDFSGDLRIASSKREFFQRSNLVSPSVSWVSVNEAVALVVHSFTGWVILDGSVGFVHEILPRVSSIRNSMKSHLLVLVPSFRLRKFPNFASLNFRWVRIRHDAVGGLTGRGYSVGVSKSFESVIGQGVESLSLSFGLRRVPSDAIKSATRGRVVDVDPKHNSILGTPIKDMSLLFENLVVPSVFSRTQWVSRRLLPVELAAFADLPELDASVVSQEGLHSIVWSTPGKIGFVVRRLLQRCAAFALDGLSLGASPGEAPTDLPTCEDVTPIVEQSHAKASNTAAALPAPVHEVSDGKTSGAPSDSILLMTPATDDAMDLLTSDYLRSYGQKAAKDDDAAVPVELWNSFLFRFYLPHLRFSPEIHGTALEVLRNKFALPVYRRLVMKSFCRYMRLTYGPLWWFLRRNLAAWSQSGGNSIKGGSFFANTLREFSKDLAVGIEGIERILQGSWWEWDYGSTLFFWRWPKLIRDQVRDGVKVFVERPLPSYRKRQQVTRDPVKLKQVGKKIDKVIQRKYLHQTYIKSLINFFDVPKGESDIRLVYDGTKSGLNDAVWAPNFFLCSVDSALMWANAETWYSDRDLGEMFLNYFLDEALRAYSGVDVTQVKAGAKAFWLAWGRTFMGFKPSPYIAAKLFGWTIDIIYGNRDDLENPFKWDSVLVNLPGQSDYDPTQPRICKLDGHLLACLLEAYVDDIRGLGSSEERCQRASSRIAQITQYLGQQDAARKCRPPHQVPGPWCGAFMASKDNCVWVYVSQAKWDKAKSFVTELSRQVNLTNSGSLNLKQGIDFKFLEKGRGFLVYFSRTYPSIVPYLKGIHLTLDSWRPNRDSEGWKIKSTSTKECDSSSYALEEFDHEDFAIGSSTHSGSSAVDHPAEVFPVRRLGLDLLALRTFLSTETPPWRFVRGGRACIAQYGFADAAKSGFGATFETKEGSTWYRLGVWSEDERNESSNFRELNNLVETLEDKAKTDTLKGLEIFLFTDNTTAELAFYKGTSSSQKLFNLVLRLRQLELHQGCIINFIHVSGSRMISQGTDGLSRGDAQEGVMKGASMSSFIPLHLSCLDRQPKLKSWLQEIISPSPNQTEIEFLSYKDWFERGHDIKGGQKNADGIWIPNYLPGTFIWTPPPAAGQIAIEQLRRARVKRELSTHVFVIPRLMAPEWQRQLFRVADLYIELPFFDLWSKNTHHEPLVIAFIFPFLSYSPWQLKRSRAFLGMGRHLRGLWKEGEVPVRSVLSQFFASTRKLETLPQSLVRQMLQSPGSLRVSRA